MKLQIILRILAILMLEFMRIISEKSEQRLFWYFQKEINCFLRVIEID